METKPQIAPQAPAHHRRLLAPLRLCAFALLLSSCAIQPRGPVVTKTVETFTNRADGLISREVMTDKAFTRGIFFFTDPSLVGVKIWHTNQTGLGGCSHFQAGSAGFTVDSNLVPAITAGGTAVGNIIGAAAKAAVK